ncbi:hypothetical protein PV327_001548 [Microctonus hyperodae]|uniref:Uncharacterized protein n=1 Tax=Microctonus hyperodae TaxID=165561 RepID=A0AA39G9Q4_MICHY|nr:hypothetical protein PV327_001548 [Microctonus hyperodae]
MGIRNSIWFSRVVRTKDDPVMDGEGTLGRGAMNGGRGLRRQRSLEWRERRGYVAGGQSSSDEESNTRHGVGTTSIASSRGSRSPGHLFASLLAHQYNALYVAATIFSMALGHIKLY